MSKGKMHLQDSSEDFTSPHLFSFMENQSGLWRERAQVCRHRTQDIYTHMRTHVHTSIRKKKKMRSLAQDFCVTPELELCGLELPKAEAYSCPPPLLPADIKGRCSKRMPSEDSWVIVVFSLKHNYQPWKLLTLTFPERLQRSF